MATVVITFFLFVHFCICKMDADTKTRRRDHIISRRRSRWSMNSQRLEQIIAELMKPISDARKSFDTDLCALLEEYLTEAGLHALDADDENGGPDDGAPGRVPPNFAELAMLLQQSASIYGRKVDYLYQNVLLVSESLHNSTLELEAGGVDDSGEGEGEPEGEDEAARRGRGRTRPALALGFEHIALHAAPGARRSTSPPRAPPTLPRVYIELEPPAAADSLALRDRDGEPLGALHEYRSAWRLRDGLLVEGEGAGAASAPPIPLLELQAALAAAPRRATPSPPATPPPPDSPSPPPPLDPPLPPSRKKRRSEIHIDDLSGGRFKIIIEDALAEYAKEWSEFRLENEWIDSVIDRRKRAILTVRRRLKLHALHPTLLDFRGFDVWGEAGGFRGWSAAEAAAAALALASEPRPLDECDSDDGFFDLSSCESEGARSPGGGGAEWARRVAARAERAPAAPDVRSLARAVLRALPPPPGAARWPQLARRAAPRPPSHVLLATLFLASAGNVSIEPAEHGPALGGFSVRLLTKDAALYAAEVATAFAPAAAPAAAPAVE